MDCHFRLNHIKHKTSLIGGHIVRSRMQKQKGGSLAHVHKVRAHGTVHHIHKSIGQQTSQKDNLLSLINNQFRAKSRR